MRTAALSLLCLALVACPKKEDPPPVPGSPSSSVSASAKPAGWVAPPVSAAKTAAPPPIDDWQEVKVKAAKLSVRIPKGASISDDNAGDDKFAGSFFRVKMPSGYDLLFAEHHGKDAVDIAAEKRRYQLDTTKKIQLVYESDESVVVNRSEDPPTGKYCEVSACGRIAGRPICASHAGALIAGTEVKKLTDVECLAVVAIARSITAL
jgi:hypothetical protein